ncbi:MAG: hypothetical protein IJK49_11060 [Prevotella sp.]|nr:hypothetical protein [Prevotella sp.]
MKQNFDVENMSPKTVEILKEIKGTWNNLQQEAYGTYLPNGNQLDPSIADYMHNVNKLEQQVRQLCDETQGYYSTQLHYFSHTVDKECAYVKNYHYDSRKSREKNYEEISKLMREANEQIELDLFPILGVTID